ERGFFFSPRRRKTGSAAKRCRSASFTGVETGIPQRNRKPDTNDLGDQHAPVLWCFQYGQRGDTRMVAKQFEDIVDDADRTQTTPRGGSTKAVHAGVSRRKAHGSLTTPIVQTATYTFNDTADLIDY